MKPRKKRGTQFALELSADMKHKLEDCAIALDVSQAGIIRRAIHNMWSNIPAKDRADLAERRKLLERLGGDR